MPVVDLEANSNEDTTEGAKDSKINETSDEMETYLEEELKKDSHQEIFKIDIENIDKIQNIHKYHKTPWRKIYEVIQQYFSEETDNFLEEFKKHFKNNANEPHSIPTNVKIT